MKNVGDEEEPHGLPRSCAACIHRIGGEYCPEERKEKVAILNTANKVWERGDDVEDLNIEDLIEALAERDIEISEERAEELLSKKQRSNKPYREHGACEEWRYMGDYTTEDMLKIREATQTRIPRDSETVKMHKRQLKEGKALT